MSTSDAMSPGAVNEVLERIWSDPDFKRKVFADPRPTLTQLGMRIPEGQQVRMWQSTAQEVHFVLPYKSELPAGQEAEFGRSVVGRVVRAAWDDEAFKRRLLADPKRAIAEAAGIEMPDALDIRVHEDTASVKNLVVPIDPNAEELGELELASIAGGKTGSSPQPGPPPWQCPMFFMGGAAAQSQMQGTAGGGK